MGSALASALSEAGFPLMAIVDQRAAKARDLAQQVGADRAGADLGLIQEDTQILIIAVPDERIADVARALSKTLPLLRWSACAHTSGALCASELANLSASGSPVASLHPLQTFPEPGPAPSLQGVFFTLEGDPEAVEILRALVNQIGGIPIGIPSASKAVYHAAAVFASNFLPVLLQATLDLLADTNIAEDQCRRMIAPLMRQSLENCLKLGPAEALTGPLARADAATVRRHLQVLQSQHPRLAPVYRMLSLKALELATEKGLSDEELDRLQRVLTEGYR